MEGAKATPQMAAHNNRKRSFDQTFSNSNLQNSPYYKMRALLKDLRPHVLEVLKTTDFRSCKAADEILQGMKLLMNHYNDMTAEFVTLEKCKNVPAYSSGGIGEGQVKLESPPITGTVIKPAEHHVQYSEITGGSAFGWNFVTFHGSEPVYYGRTKELFRAANPKS